VLPIDCGLFVDVEGLNGFGWFCFGIVVDVGVGADLSIDFLTIVPCLCFVSCSGWFCCCASLG